MAADDTLRAGPTLPSPVLRGILLLCAAGAALSLFSVVGWQVIVIGLGALAAAVPATLAAWVVVGCLPIALLMEDPQPWRTCVAVLAAHLLHVLGSLTLAVPLRSSVALAALLPAARRFAAIQLPVQAVTILALTALPRADGTEGDGWWAVAGAAALLSAALLLMRAGKRTDART